MRRWWSGRTRAPAPYTPELRAQALLSHSGLLNFQRRSSSMVCSIFSAGKGGFREYGAGGSSQRAMAPSRGQVAGGQGRSGSSSKAAVTGLTSVDGGAAQSRVHVRKLVPVRRAACILHGAEHSTCKW